MGTTSIIMARRIVASINGNPEFDAAVVGSPAIEDIVYLRARADWTQMLRPYTQAYVSLV